MIDTGRSVAVNNNHEHLKPATYVSYNSSKTGVDKQDQMASYYPFSRKTIKWWKKLFFWLFQIGVVNAYKYYNAQNNTKIMLYYMYIWLSCLHSSQSSSIQDFSQYHLQL